MVQYVAMAPGRPWSQDHIASNKNAIMGFFADYAAAAWYAYAQLLIDGIDLNSLVDPAGVQNPWMMALSMGGHYDSVDRGRFGAYAAAALKYTFQSFGSDTVNYQYSYSVYPANAYWYDGSWYGIDMETSMLGYRNGENDLSFCGTWDGSLRSGLAVLDSVVAHQELEFSITGSQSPGNPWHDMTNFDAFPGYTIGMGTTGFLDDPRLLGGLHLEHGLIMHRGPASGTGLCT